MHVGIVGVGFVGLTHAAVTARFGHNVTAYDIDSKKIDAFKTGEKEKIEQYIYEKDLASLVTEELSKDRLKFTNNISKLTDADVLFMCLPTPYKVTGESDLSFLFNAINDISDKVLPARANKFTLIVDKSTVPIGTAAKVYQIIASKGITQFDVASNPEFLPEGEAVAHAIRSSKVVVGANKNESFTLLRGIYASFVNSPNTHYVECNPETAEAIKYVSNTILYNQIIAWQAIGGRVGEAFSEIDFETLRRGVLADSRIAKWGSYISAGAGGSCFKKDALSLAFQLNNKGFNPQYIKLLDETNEMQKIYLIDRAINEGNYSFNKKNVALLGASFKQGTNDMRESNILVIVPRLLAEGVQQINIYDPLAISNAKKIFDPEKNQNFNRITYHDTATNAIKETDCAMILTDHQEFRSLQSIILDSAIQKNITTPYFLIDGRRMIPTTEITPLNNHDIAYISVGGTYRPATKRS